MCAYSFPCFEDLFWMLVDHKTNRANKSNLLSSWSIHGKKLKLLPEGIRVFGDGDRAQDLLRMFVDFLLVSIRRLRHRDIGGNGQ